MTNRVGQQFGNYRLIRLLGTGSFAEVYLGEHIHLGTQAAIKILDARLQQQEAERFLEEARTIFRLIHPNIIRLLEFGMEGSTPFMVIDYAPNGNLRDRHATGAQLPVPTIVSYVKQIADALQYAHDEKVIHRDIKPANMLLGRRNEILLSDFGIAVIAHSTFTQKTEDLIGTPSYMAPEQIQKHPTRASDQYALGVIVYQWLSGSLPFEGSAYEVAIKHLSVPPPPLHTRVSAISPEVEQVVLKALAKDPKKRFASIQEFATNLAQACKTEDGERGSQEQGGPEHQESLPPRKIHVLFLTLVLAFLLVIGGVIGSIELLLHARSTISPSHAITLTPSPITSTPSQGAKPVTPTPNILITAEAGRLVNHDVLTSSSTQKAYWQSVGSLNSQCIFASDGYHVRITASWLAICHERSKSWQDFAISIDMTLHGGGSGGLLFRDQAIVGGNGAYFFEVGSKGNYKISIISAINKVLQGWTSSSAIRQGGNVRNTLQVIASGDILLFFINGVYLTRVTDGTFSYGGISFACFNSKEAIFSNLYVYLHG